MAHKALIAVLLALASALLAVVLVSFVFPLHWAAGDLVAESPKSDWTAGWGEKPNVVEYLPADEYLLRNGRLLWLRRSIERGDPRYCDERDGTFHRWRSHAYKLLLTLDLDGMAYDRIDLRDCTLTLAIRYEKLVLSRWVPSLILVLLAAYPAFAFGRDPVTQLVKRIRYKRGFCRECGYNLTGNVSGVCSECGTPVPADDVSKEREGAAA